MFNNDLFAVAVSASVIALYWFLRLYPLHFEHQSRQRNIANVVCSLMGVALVWLSYAVLMYLPASAYKSPHRVPPRLNRLDTFIAEHNLLVGANEQAEFIDPPTKPKPPPFSFSRVPFKWYYPKPRHVITNGGTIPSPRFENEASKEHFLQFELPLAVALSFGVVLYLSWPFASLIRDTFPTYRIRVNLWFTSMSIAVVNVILLRCEADKNLLLLHTAAVGSTVGACRTLVEDTLLRTNYRLIQHLAAILGALLAGLLYYSTGILSQMGATLILAMVAAIVASFALPYVLPPKTLRFCFVLGILHGILRLIPLLILAAMLLLSWVGPFPGHQRTHPVDNWIEVDSSEVGDDKPSKEGYNSIGSFPRR